MSTKKKSNAHNVKVFLIIDGTKVAIIDEQIFGIGRKEDNAVVIDNPHVSRHHAEIRLIDGKYVLFDLESTVGTSVNGKRVQEAVLSPGDVISIGGVPMIFGVGSPGPLPDASQPTDTATGPTDATDIEDLDAYLGLFSDNSSTEDSS